MITSSLPLLLWFIFPYKCGDHEPKIEMPIPDQLFSVITKFELRLIYAHLKISSYTVVVFWSKDDFSIDNTRVTDYTY